MANASLFIPKSLLKTWRRPHCFHHTRASPKDHEPSASTATCPPPPNSLLGLPDEIKQAIFSSLADVASLKALILTCSSLYHAFLKVESLILAQILQNQINPNLMHDALATLKSSQIDPWCRLAGENVIMLYTTGETSSLLPTWNLRNALAVSELHGHIQFFANNFASSALSQNPVTGLPETDPAPASPSELIRIQRTLYRFELYCNLFAERRRSFGGYFETFNVNEQGRYLAAGFAPWENEQLACIRDYLIGTLSKCTFHLWICIKSLQIADRSSFQQCSRPCHLAGSLQSRPGQELEQRKPKEIPLARLGTSSPTHPRKDTQTTRSAFVGSAVDRQRYPPRRPE